MKKRAIIVTMIPMIALRIPKPRAIQSNITPLNTVFGGLLCFIVKSYYSILINFSEQLYYLSEVANQRFL